MKKLLGLTLLAVAMLGVSAASAQKFARINLQEQMEQIQVEFNNKLADFQKNQNTMAASIKQMKQQELEQLQQRFSEFQTARNDEFTCRNTERSAEKTVEVVDRYTAL